jgi:hypothetical protein
MRRVGLIRLCSAAALTLGAGVARAAGPPPKVLAHVFHSGVPVRVAEEVESGLRLALGATQDLTLLPAWRRPEPARGGADLGQADGALAEAETQFGRMELDKAARLTEEAIDVYRREVVSLAARPSGTQPLRDAFIELAKIRYFDGNNDGARDALRYAFVLDPALKFTPKVFPQQMRKTVLDARGLFETLGEAGLIVKSEPAGAAVYVNGARRAEPTPTPTLTVRAGPNYVTVELPGHQATTELVEVGFRETLTVTRTLIADERASDPLAEAGARFAAADLDRPLRRAAERLGADVLLLVRASGTSTGGVHLEGLCYDARAGRVLGRGERTAEDRWLEGEAQGLAAELAAPLQPRQKVAEAPARQSRWQRFRRSRAFWWVVGGAAGALALGVSVGVGVGVAESRAAELAAARRVVLIGGR